MPKKGKLGKIAEEQLSPEENMKKEPTVTQPRKWKIRSGQGQVKEHHCVFG